MRQVVEITLMNLRSIPRRMGISFVICVGTASVVAVLVTVLSMATGLVDTLTSAAAPDRVVVMRKGALAESLSSLSREAVLAVETAPGIATRDGRAAVSPEVVLSVDLPRRDGNGNMAVFLRGITQSGWVVRSDLALLDGRRFDPGKLEVVVGKTLENQVSGVAIGDRLPFYGNEWTVVGVFGLDGASTESQMIVDAFTLMSASNRTVYSSVRAIMDDMAGFDAFKTSLESNPQILVQADKEADYLERQAESASGLLKLVAYVVSAIMALGALFGAVNTMYTAVAARTAEIATLRAVGFGGLPVVVSVLAEALMLSFGGALLGALASWILFNGMDFNAGGQLGAIGVELHVGVPVILIGMIWACVIGLLAGLFPAVRAARLPIAEGLRVSA
jgi:putative ABC transport system permease protein